MYLVLNHNIPMFLLTAFNFFCSVLRCNAAIPPVQSLFPIRIFFDQKSTVTERNSQKNRFCDYPITMHYTQRTHKKICSKRVSSVFSRQSVRYCRWTVGYYLNTAKSRTKYNWNRQKQHFRLTRARVVYAGGEQFAGRLESWFVVRAFLNLTIEPKTGSMRMLSTRLFVVRFVFSWASFACT